MPMDVANLRTADRARRVRRWLARGLGFVIGALGILAMMPLAAACRPRIHHFHMAVEAERVVLGTIVARLPIVEWYAIRELQTPNMRLVIAIEEHWRGAGPPQIRIAVIDSPAFQVGERVLVFVGAGHGAILDPLDSPAFYGDGCLPLCTIPDGGTPAERFDARAVWREVITSDPPPRTAEEQRDRARFRFSKATCHCLKQRLEAGTTAMRKAALEWLLATELREEVAFAVRGCLADRSEQVRLLARNVLVGANRRPAPGDARFDDAPPADQPAIFRALHSSLSHLQRQQTALAWLLAADTSDAIATQFLSHRLERDPLTRELSQRIAAQAAMSVARSPDYGAILAREFELWLEAQEVPPEYEWLLERIFNRLHAPPPLFPLPPLYFLAT